MSRYASGSSDTSEFRADELFDPPAETLWMMSLPMDAEQARSKLRQLIEPLDRKPVSPIEEGVTEEKSKASQQPHYPPPHFIPSPPKTPERSSQPMPSSTPAKWYQSTETVKILREGEREFWKIYVADRLFAMEWPDLNRYAAFSSDRLDRIAKLAEDRRSAMMGKDFAAIKEGFEIESRPGKKVSVVEGAFRSTALEKSPYSPSAQSQSPAVPSPLNSDVALRRSGRLEFRSTSSMPEASSATEEKTRVARHWIRTICEMAVSDENGESLFKHMVYTDSTSQFPIAKNQPLVVSRKPDGVLLTSKKDKDQVAWTDIGVLFEFTTESTEVGRDLSVLPRKFQQGAMNSICTLAAQPWRTYVLCYHIGRTNAVLTIVDRECLRFLDIRDCWDSGFGQMAAILNVLCTMTVYEAGFSPLFLFGRHDSRARQLNMELFPAWTVDKIDLEILPVSYLHLRPFCRGTIVARVKSTGLVGKILKVQAVHNSRLHREVKLLRMLKGVPQVCQMLHSAAFFSRPLIEDGFADRHYEVILLKNEGKTLMDPSLKMKTFFTVMIELVETIWGIWKKHQMLHRDLSFGNVMWYGNHLLLIDFDCGMAANNIETPLGKSERIARTGTLDTMSIDVLEYGANQGFLHQPNDDLESIVYVFLKTMTKRMRQTRYNLDDESAENKIWEKLHFDEMVPDKQILRCRESIWGNLGLQVKDSFAKGSEPLANVWSGLIRLQLGNRAPQEHKIDKRLRKVKARQNPEAAGITPFDEWRKIRMEEFDNDCRKMKRIFLSAAKQNWDHFATRWNGETADVEEDMANLAIQPTKSP